MNYEEGLSQLADIDQVAVHAKLYHNIRLLANFILSSSQNKSESERVPHSQRYFLKHLSKQQTQSMIKLSMDKLAEETRPYYKDFINQDFTDKAVKPRVVSFICDNLLKL